MAHSSSVFSRIPIDLPNRSGFDMSHENLGTLTCGTLTPVLVDELLPNDTISLGASFQVQLPPMATDFFGRVDVVLEAFFVPCRLLWGGWKSFMTHPTAGPQYPSGTPVEGKSRYIPQVGLSREEMLSGSLADYLGIKSRNVSTSFEGNTYFNALPFVAYHRIYDDWYRDSRIQSPLFYAPDLGTVFGGASNNNISFLPYISGGVDSPYQYNEFNDAIFSDGVNITELRQRNWSKDYFTTASTLPQAGNAATLTFDIDTSAENGTFSIAALRAANSLQKWMERNNIAGYKYSDQIYAQYGIYPSDAIMDKCIYLGRKSQNVYTRSVFQTNASKGADVGNFGNPFKAVGSKYGSSQSVGEGSLIDQIRVTEHGYLFVLASLVPHAYYSTGIRRYLNRSVVGDIAFPLLSGMGDQAIMTSELHADSKFLGSDSVFGYTDLYAEYKYHDDEIHGFLRDGETLESFALQRGFDEAPQLSSSFLQIPKEYLDQVFATSSQISGFSAWYDIYFPYKKVSTLPECSLPTLADLKDVHKGYMSRGGKRL